MYNKKVTVQSIAVLNKSGVENNGFVCTHIKRIYCTNPFDEALLRDVSTSSKISSTGYCIGLKTSYGKL